MEDNSEKKNNKGLIIIIITLGLIVLGFGGWIIYDKMHKEPVNPSKNNNQQNANSTWSEEDYENYEFKDENGNIIKVGDLTKLNDNYLAIVTEDTIYSNTPNTAYIFDVRQKKVVLTETDNVEDAFVIRFINLSRYDYDNTIKNNNYIGLENKCAGSCSDNFIKIYTGDLKLLSDDFIDYNLESDSITIFSSDSIKTFDAKGNVIKEISKYKNIIDFSKNYVLYLNDNKLVVSNTDNDELIVTFGTISSDETIHSGYISLDDNGEYDGVSVFTESDKITYKEALNDLKKEDAYDIAPGFDYETEEELKNYDRAYLYTYNFKTQKSSKNAIFLPSDF